jgi:DNA-binding NarL/FixJ family response regulator
LKRSILTGGASLQMFPELSDREREILDFIAPGHKNPEIAKEHYLIPKTVRNYVSNIRHKLQVADRTEAIIPRPRGRARAGDGSV